MSSGSVAAIAFFLLLERHHFNPTSHITHFSNLEEKVYSGIIQGSVFLFLRIVQASSWLSQGSSISLC